MWHRSSMMRRKASSRGHLLPARVRRRLALLLVIATQNPVIRQCLHLVLWQLPTIPMPHRMECIWPCHGYRRLSLRQQFTSAVLIFQLQRLNPYHRHRWLRQCQYNPPVLKMYSRGLRIRSNRRLQYLILRLSIKDIVSGSYRRLCETYSRDQWQQNALHWHHWISMRTYVHFIICLCHSILDKCHSILRECGRILGKCASCFVELEYVNRNGLWRTVVRSFRYATVSASTTNHPTAVSTTAVVATRVPATIITAAAAEWEWPVSEWWV